MQILFVNAAFRDGSRTKVIADEFLKKCTGNITEVELGRADITPLNTELLKIYNEAVAAHDFAHPMFDVAKQFVDADEIVIAAPFWDYGIPAILHNYLELVCTQGISFDISEEGVYFSGCKAKKLVYITTAGGYIPENDHAFGYINTLAREFWRIPEIRYIKADGLDVYGTNVEEEITKAISQF